MHSTLLLDVLETNHIKQGKFDTEFGRFFLILKPTVELKSMS